MDKRKIPLIIHDTLEKHIMPNRDKFDLKFEDSPKGLFMEIRGKKPNEEFFFKFQENGANAKGYHDKVVCSPYSEYQIKGEKNITFGSISTHLESWLKLISRYESLQSPFFEDPVVSEYEEEFFNQWKILEEDADTKPFDLQRQLLIDKYLESSIQKLEAQKTKENEKEIEAIKAQGNEVRQNLTRQTKNQVVRGLAKFWAMARKMGLDVLRDIFIDLASGVIQKMLIG